MTAPHAGASQGMRMCCRQGSSRRFRGSSSWCMIFPENIAKSVADNQILQVAVFAVFFGLALGRLSEEQTRSACCVLPSR